MKTLIKGKNYKFLIKSGVNEFYIKAIHLLTSRFSYINNLNIILSELKIPINDTRVSESQWIMDKKQCFYFYKKIMKLLANEKNRNYIESKLDEDRECGEWESIIP